MLEPIQNALLALAFLACGGLHIVLRLLSLHLCNEYPSLPKKKKKKSWIIICQSWALGEVHYRHKKGLLLLSQLSDFGWRDIGDTLALYFGGVHCQHKTGLLLLSQLGGFGWRDIGDTLALYFSIFSRFFPFFLGYRGDVHPLTAKHRQRNRTNLICAGTTA